MNRTDLESQGERVARERMGEREHRAGGRGFEVDRWREIGQNLGEQIDRQVRRRPYVIVGAAAGIGFVAGSLLGSKLGQMLLAMGIGFFVKSALDGDFSTETVRAGLEKFAGPEK